MGDLPGQLVDQLLLGARGALDRLEFAGEPVEVLHHVERGLVDADLRDQCGVATARGFDLGLGELLIVEFRITQAATQQQAATRSARTRASMSALPVGVRSEDLAWWSSSRTI